MSERKLTTFSLTWPIFIETLLRSALMAVDTFMLSSYADEAAAAVGMIQQFSWFLLIIYMMGATGASILVSQYLGAKQNEHASEIARSAIIFNLILGLLLSLIARLVARSFLGTLGLDPLVLKYSQEYLLIYVSFSFFQAVSLVFSNILRSYGYSKTPMLVNMGANIINAIGNYLFIFGPFGIPVLGVSGVAISTITSQAIGALVLFFILTRKQDIKLLHGKLSLNWPFIRDIFKIGIPAAGEFLAYNTSQIAILYFVTSLGTAALAAYTYVQNLIRFGFVIAMSLGHSTQILVGHLVGAKDLDQAYKRGLTNLGWGILFSAICSGMMALFRMPLLKLLTQDPAILEIAGTLMLISFIHELARPMNLIVISSLRGAGDVRFPVVMGVFSMWGIGVLLSFVFGKVLGWGMVGIWFARLLDEYIRGGVMVFRWRGGKWRSMGFVQEKK